MQRAEVVQITTSIVVDRHTTAEQHGRTVVTSEFYHTGNLQKSWQVKDYICDHLQLWQWIKSYADLCLEFAALYSHYCVMTVIMCDLGLHKMSHFMSVCWQINKISGIRTLLRALYLCKCVIPFLFFWCYVFNSLHTLLTQILAQCYYFSWHRG